MTRTELVKEVSEKSQVSRKDTEAVVKEVFEVITEHLSQGQEVAIKGFGTFSVQVRPERQGRNPATGQAITVAEKRIPKVKFSSEVKKIVNVKE